MSMLLFLMKIQTVSLQLCPVIYFFVVAVATFYLVNTYETIECLIKNISYIVNFICLLSFFVVWLEKNNGND